MIWPVWSVPWCVLLCAYVDVCLKLPLHFGVFSVEGQKVSVTGLTQNGTVTSGMKWKECKYVPNDLGEKQSRSLSRRSVLKQCLEGVFSKTTRKMGTKSASVTCKLPTRNNEPPFFISAIQADPAELTADVCRLCQDPSSVATPHKGHALLFSVWSSAMELQDNQPHGCPRWLVTPFQGQKHSVSPLIWASHKKC